MTEYINLAGLYLLAFAVGMLFMRWRMRLKRPQPSFFTRVYLDRLRRYSHEYLLDDPAVTVREFIEREHARCHTPLVGWPDKTVLACLRSKRVMEKILKDAKQWSEANRRGRGTCAR